MKRVETFKRVLALVILVCLFLPLAQCGSRLSADGSVRAGPPQDLVAAEQVSLRSTDGAAILVLFAWPLVFVALRRGVRSPRGAAVVNAVEGLLAAASIYWVTETIGLWGAVRWGGVVLLTSFGLYLLCVAAALRACWRGPPTGAAPE